MPSHAFVQAADVRAGMVNVRSDDDMNPEDVMQSYEPKVCLNSAVRPTQS